MRDDIVVEISGAKRLLSKCVSVDLEVDPKTNWIQTFAAVRPGLDEAFVYRRGNLADAFRGLDEFAEGAEFSVLNDEPDRAAEHLADAVAVIRETWEPGTTANNLQMIGRARASRGADTAWLLQIIHELKSRAG